MAWDDAVREGFDEAGRPRNLSVAERAGTGHTHRKISREAVQLLGQVIHQYGTMPARGAVLGAAAGIEALRAGHNALTQKGVQGGRAGLKPAEFTA
jgi:hypothetical protein